jgi:hypothetical protein
LLQTLGANTPVLPILLKGIVGNSSLSNRMELIAKLDEMMQPNPQQQEMEQMQQQLAIQDCTGKYCGSDYPSRAKSC